MKYKLICSDLDGTLLRHDFTLPEEYINEIKKLKLQGYRVTVATGRNFEGAKSFVEALGIEEPMIFSNGCTLHDPALDKEELVFGVPKEAAKALVKLHWDFELSLKVHMPTGHLYKSKDMPWPHEVTHFPIGVVRSDLEELIVSDPIKIVAHGKPEEMERFKVAILKYLGESSPIRLFRSHEYYLEITDAKVSKGAALALLIDRMGIEKEEVVTLGDHENDYEMLAGFGLGIQVGEHCDSLKEVAHHQIDSPEELGFLRLSEILEGKEN